MGLFRRKKKNDKNRGASQQYDPFRAFMEAEDKAAFLQKRSSEAAADVLIRLAREVKVDEDLLRAAFEGRGYGDIVDRHNYSKDRVSFYTTWDPGSSRSILLEVLTNHLVNFHPDVIPDLVEALKERSLRGTIPAMIRALSSLTLVALYTDAAVEPTREVLQAYKKWAKEPSGDPLAEFEKWPMMALAHVVLEALDDGEKVGSSDVSTYLLEKGVERKVQEWIDEKGLIYLVLPPEASPNQRAQILGSVFMSVLHEMNPDVEEDVLRGFAQGLLQRFGPAVRNGGVLLLKKEDFVLRKKE